MALTERYTFRGIIIINLERGKQFCGNLKPTTIKKMTKKYPNLTTVNIEIFAQYIYSRISMVLIDARKYDVSENLNYYRSKRIELLYA